MEIVLEIVLTIVHEIVYEIVLKIVHEIVLKIALAFPFFVVGMVPYRLTFKLFFNRRELEAVSSSHCYFTILKPRKSRSEQFFKQNTILISA